MPTPRDVLAENHRQALDFAKGAGLERVREVLRDAADDLKERIRTASELKGLGEDTFSITQMRASLAQIRQVTRDVQAGVRDSVLEAGDVAADAAATNTVQYLEGADKHFKGVGTTPLDIKGARLVDAATSGVKASLLRRLASSGESIAGADAEAHPAKAGILERYGVETVGHFERILQKGLLTKKPWGELRDEITEASPFLKGAPKHWAERIVRTETMGAYNRAGFEAVRAADEELGDMVKILSATFDDRTGADSFAVHGQIRRPAEAFMSWFGLYQHPPNRPNDREIVVPHRIAWVIPPYLGWKSAAEIAARWRLEGRRGSPPARPTMTTVPLESFGRAAEKKPAPARGK